MDTLTAPAARYAGYGKRTSKTYVPVELMQRISRVMEHVNVDFSSVTIIIPSVKENLNAMFQVNDTS